MTGPWSHQWADEPVSVFVMAEVLDVDCAEVRAAAVRWAEVRAAAAVDVGRPVGPDDQAYADERACILTPAAARAVWGQFF